MPDFRAIFKRNFFIRLRSWEYWPFGFVQAPIFLYYPILALRTGSLFFFSASNPGILMGGMFGESKFEVLELIPKELKPKTILIKLHATLETITRAMAESGISYPAIFKPDLGERGWMVRKIHDDSEALEYLREIKIEFLVQEFVGLPLEFGVFYIRYPSESQGKVTSIVEKEMLSITGDGVTTIQDLIQRHDRALLQWEILRKRFASRLGEVLAANQMLELNSIGNHSLGTKFLDGASLINDKLSHSFDRISLQVPGFFFGRYDLRAASYEDLENGKVLIVELNGCGAEPAHIYQPGYSIWKAFGVMIRHWQDIFRISRENHARGVPYISFAEGRSIYRKFKAIIS